ncbi:putative GPI-anchored protein 27 [Candida viswanathii]|uniref:Putative GPI-anchored protein 27 n=1 Tax=Candida viswanathii TaxID=5486 RepID=A0A367XPV6_9ASCO|nr:putative GPI-anchored protein 27 [Candida viswanathii]
MSDLQNTSQAPSNDTISLFLNHFQIFKDLLPYNDDKRPKIKETRPLIQVLKDGVPVNFNHVPALIIRKNVMTITLEAPATSELTIAEAPEATDSSLFMGERPRKSVNRMDPLDEIRRLEKLLLSLKKEMMDQQEMFKNQLMSIYHASPAERGSVLPTMTTLVTHTTTSLVVPSLADHMTTSMELHPSVDLNPTIATLSTSITSTTETLPASITSTTEPSPPPNHHHADKIHPKDIWNQKNPPNSVLIVPQFKYHQKDATVTAMAYSKPKQIIWTNFPTTTPHIFYQNNHFLFHHDEPTTAPEFVEEHELVQDQVEEAAEPEQLEVTEAQAEEEVGEIIEKTFFQARFNRHRTTFEDPFLDLMGPTRMVRAEPATTLITTTTSTTTTTTTTTTSTTQSAADSYTPRPQRRKSSVFQSACLDNPSFKFDVFDWIFENASCALNSMKMTILVVLSELVFLFLL